MRAAKQVGNPGLMVGEDKAIMIETPVKAPLTKEDIMLALALVDDAAQLKNVLEVIEFYRPFLLRGLIG